MGARKLTHEERNELLVRLGERQSTLKIGREMGVTRQAIEYHWVKNRAKVEQLQAEWDARLIERGLANRAVRIARLERLAERIEDRLDLDDDDRGLYYLERKPGPMGVVEQEMFNAPMVKEWRGLLDDIAKELGHREKQVSVQHGGGIGVEIGDASRTLRDDPDARRLAEALCRSALAGQPDAGGAGGAGE